MRKKQDDPSACWRQLAEYLQFGTQTAYIVPDPGELSGRFDREDRRVRRVGIVPIALFGYHRRSPHLAHDILDKHDDWENFLAEVSVLLGIPKNEADELDNLHNYWDAKRIIIELRQRGLPPSALRGIAFKEAFQQRQKN